MKHIVSFSSGMGSFAEAESCVDKFGKENVVLLFADTLIEDEDNYRFLQEATTYLDCELVKLCYGKTPWELFEKQKFVANSRVDSCSRVLKRELLNKYIGKTYGIDVEVPILDYKKEPLVNIYGKSLTSTVRHLDAEVHLGIDFSEHHRLTRVQNNMRPWVYRSTLVEEGRIIPKDYSEKFGIEKPRLYKMGFGHANCGGFCVKAGLGHFKTLYEVMPERYKEHEDIEISLANKCNTKPFLKKTINNVTNYITMRQYREEYLEVGKAEEDTFDIGGCGCAI